MIITVLNVSEPVQEQGRQGPYYNISVTHETDQGKLEQKKIVSFTFPDVYQYLKGVTRGAKVEITRVKNAKGYWDWTSAREATSTTVPQESPSSGNSYAGTSAPVAGNPRPVSNYETKEERAWKQILIVRQSSVSNAIALLKTEKGANAGLDVTLAAAAEIEAWVNRKQDPVQVLADLPDDIPQ